MGRGHIDQRINEGKLKNFINNNLILSTVIYRILMSYKSEDCFVSECDSQSFPEDLFPSVESFVGMSY